MKFRLIGLAASFALLAPLPVDAAVLTLFNVNGDTAADITPTVDSFRDALGPNNGNAPVNGDPNDRRQIDWDAAPDSVAQPNDFPGDFFNFASAPRARGIEFRPVGSTEGFQLSATEASGTAPSFGVPTDFQPFSPERLFRPLGGTTFDVLFFDPVNPDAPALTRGLGVVFSDVEQEQSTSMSFFDANDDLIFEGFATPGNDIGFSFLGAIFDTPEVARVRIQSGFASDSVVMDDFIFGEPIPAAAVPLPATAMLLPLGLAALGGLRRRKAARLGSDDSRLDNMRETSNPCAGFREDL